jgi:hypothetical protein
VSFTATASGTPSPTVQWQVSTDGGTTFSDIAGAISTTFGVPGVEEHTDFYLHTLAEYVAWFTGREATFTSVDAPESSRAAGSAARVLQALDLADDVEVGDAVVVDLPGVGPVAAGLSYRTASFVGLRTASALVRVFGREAWGPG